LLNGNGTGFDNNKSQLAAVTAACDWHSCVTDTINLQEMFQHQLYMMKHIQTQTATLCQLINCLVHVLTIPTPALKNLDDPAVMSPNPQTQPYLWPLTCNGNP